MPLSPRNLEIERIWYTCMRSNFTYSIVAASLVCIAGMLAPTAQAQSGTFFNQRDDTYPLLGLKRAREAYETARLEYERQAEMYEKRLLSRQEYDRSRSKLGRCGR